jgi:hypothetical protein
LALLAGLQPAGGLAGDPPPFTESEVRAILAHGPLARADSPRSR